MPMNHMAHACALKRLAHGLQIHIANVLALLVSLALSAHLARDRQSFSERPRKKRLLPDRGSNFSAKALVSLVVGAPRITVREQHRKPEQLDDRGVVKQLRAVALGPGWARRGAAQQKVAIAAHQRDPNTAL